MNWNSKIFYNKNIKNNKFPKFGEKRKFSELINHQDENTFNQTSNNINSRINDQIKNLNLNNLNINNSNFSNERSVQTAFKDNTNNRNSFINNLKEDLVNKGNIFFFEIKTL